jgi:hypothetical protein
MGTSVRIVAAILSQAEDIRIRTFRMKTPRVTLNRRGTAFCGAGKVHFQFPGTILSPARNKERTIRALA